MSPGYEKLTGYSRANMLANLAAVFDLVHPEDRNNVMQAVRCAGSSPCELECRIVRRDGEVRWIWVQAKPIFDEAGTGTVVRWVGVARDITEYKAYHSQIEHMAYSDPLTGLPNRRRLYKVGQAALDAAHATRVTLLYLDLDKFKAVNDTLGHEAGDIVLVQVSHRLQHYLRTSDLLVRLGGDEFAVLLLHTEVFQAQIVAHRLIDALRKPFVLADQQITLGVSIGIASGTAHTSTFERLLNQADLAMLRAKRTGRGLLVYDPATCPASP